MNNIKLYYLLLMKIKLIYYYLLMTLFMNFNVMNFIMSILIMMLLIQNFNNIISTPFKLNFIILIISFIIIILINYILKINIFSIVIFLMMISGLMILFLYFNSFSKNKMNLNFMNKLNMKMKFILFFIMMINNSMHLIIMPIKKSNIFMNPLLLMINITPSNLFMLFLILLLLYIMIISSYMNSFKLMSLRKF